MLYIYNCSVSFKVSIKIRLVCLVTNFFELWKSPPNDMIFDVYTYAFAKKRGYKILRFPVTFDKEKRLSGKGNNDTLAKTIKGSIEHLKSSVVLRFNLK